MQNNTQNWEEEFEKKLLNEWVNQIDYDDIQSLKSFIRALLSKQAEEISEAVEGMKKEGTDVQKFDFDSFGGATPSCVEKELSSTDEVYNQALKDVIKLLAIKQVINKTI